MFAGRFFAARYFAPRYFAPAGGASSTVDYQGDIYYYDDYLR